MKKLKKTAKKVIGNPLFSVRVPTDFLQEIERWRDRHQGAEVRKLTIQACLLRLARKGLDSEKS